MDACCEVGAQAGCEVGVDPKEVAAVNSSDLEVVRVADDMPLADLKAAVAALTALGTRLEAASPAPAKPKKFGRKR